MSTNHNFDTRVSVEERYPDGHTFESLRDYNRTKTSLHIFVAMLVILFIVAVVFFAAIVRELYFVS